MKYKLVSEDGNTGIFDRFTIRQNNFWNKASFLSLKQANKKGNLN